MEQSENIESVEGKVQGRLREGIPPNAQRLLFAESGRKCAYFAKKNTITLEEKEDTVVNLKAKTQVERDPMHPARLIFTEAGILVIITARTVALLACNVQSIIPSDFVTSVRNHEGYFRVIRALQFSNHKPHILGLVILDVLPGQVVYTRFSSLGRTRPIQ